MGTRKSKISEEIEYSILKIRIKNDLLNEFEQIIAERVEEIVGPSVAKIIGSILDFPLSVKQFAKLTGKSDSCIYKMCQREQIPYTKKGGKIYINLKDVNYQLLRTKTQI